MKITNRWRNDDVIWVKNHDIDDLRSVDDVINHSEHDYERLITQSVMICNRIFDLNMISAVFSFYFNHVMSSRDVIMWYKIFQFTLIGYYLNDINDSQLWRQDRPCIVFWKSSNKSRTSGNGEIEQSANCDGTCVLFFSLAVTSLLNCLMLLFQLFTSSCFQGWWSARKKEK